MNIMIIGSHQYEHLMEQYKAGLMMNEIEANDVKLPGLDHHKEFKNELEMIEHNRASIEWADEVHVFWDRRSIGTVFDFGMCVMARKKIKIIYLEPKTIEGLMKQYADNRG